MFFYFLPFLIFFKKGKEKKNTSEEGRGVSSGILAEAVEE